MTKVFSKGELVPTILLLKMAKSFLRRTGTQYFMTKHDKVFSKNSYPQFREWKWQSFFSGEVVPNILWMKMTVFHQISYPRSGGYKFSRRTRTLIMMSTISPGEVVARYDFSRRNRTLIMMSTISPGEVVARYDFSRRNCTRVRLLQEKSYPIFWVRFLLGTTSLGYDFSRSRL
jgi:hypothetical protein